MAFSPDMKYLAVSAEETPTIRVFDLNTRSLAKEVRREFYNSRVTSIHFHKDQSRWLLISDDMGDCEIFFTKEMTKKELELCTVKNRRSSLRFLSFISGYFDSEWSFAFHHNNEEFQCKSRFLGDGTFVIISKNGYWSHLTFDMLFGGSCYEVKETQNFITSY